MVHLLNLMGSERLTKITTHKCCYLFQPYHCYPTDTYGSMIFEIHIYQYNILETFLRLQMGIQLSCHGILWSVQHASFQLVMLYRSMVCIECNTKALIWQFGLQEERQDSSPQLLFSFIRTTTKNWMPAENQHTSVERVTFFPYHWNSGFFSVNKSNNKDFGYFS